MSNWVKVAEVGEIPQGRVKALEAGGQRVVVANIQGDLFAIQDLCTHDDGPLGEGELLGGQIECPRHGARFDVKTGQALTLPAVLPVKIFPVKVTGSEVFVEL